MSRLGRGRPQKATIIRSQAGKVASGSAVTRGGGAVTQSGQKGGRGAVATRGGGSLTGAGTKAAFSAVITSGGGYVFAMGNAPQFGMVVTSGGGRVTGMGYKSIADPASPVTGGGAVNQTGRKNARGTSVTSAGGAIVSTAMKQVEGSASTSGGGAVTQTGAKVVAVEEVSLRPSPDLNGFRAAMRHKRKMEVLGEHITFLWPVTYVWPGGTILDPDNGTPYDPTIVPTSSARASATLPGGVFFRAVNRAGIGGEAEGEAPGFLDKSDAMVILNSGYASAVEGSDSFIARNSEFETRAMKFDGVTDIDRYLVYGAREKAAPE